MSTSSDLRTTAVALTGMAAGAAVFAYLSERRHREQAAPERAKPAPQEQAEQANQALQLPIAQSAREDTANKEAPRATSNMAPTESRSRTRGNFGRTMKPVVIASPALEDLAQLLRKRLGSKTFGEDQGQTVYLDKFKSNDLNGKFNWERVNGRKVVLLFDTVDQSRFFEQLALLQALQGFAVPDATDESTKWKTYVDSGSYSWGRASSISVVLPWYRPCQMERTSRWHLDDGKWTNGDPNGEWLDLPCALYMARLLSTPGAVPPLPGPSSALDGMPLEPLWRPPLELVFVELHEEKPVGHSVTDLNVDVRMVRYVPYFLDKYKAKKAYPGKAHMYVLFPDHGAYDRYVDSVAKHLKLDFDHILFIKKVRVGESISQSQQLCYEVPGEIRQPGDPPHEKKEFTPQDQILIIDDFTNSGGTLFGAVDIIKGKTKGEGVPAVDIFVSHLVAVYDEKVVAKLKEKLHTLGDRTRFFVTNSIPLTTNLLKDDPQVEICDLSDFIAETVQN